MKSHNRIRIFTSATVVASALVGSSAFGVTFDRSDLVNIDALTVVNYSGIFHNPRRRTSKVNVSVTNISASSIDTPLIYVTESISAPTVTVANADGTTTPDGKPLHDLTGQVPGAQLDPGESTIDRSLVFNNPILTPFVTQASVNSLVTDTVLVAPHVFKSPATNPTGRAAGLINGDFETGDLTGWTASAIDGSGTSLDPSSFVAVANVGGNNVARFKTGVFSEGLFVGTLEQSFTVDAGQPLLSFDFALPTVFPDATGAGVSPFLDALVVSVDDGTDSFELLLLDQFGALADPFGTAPGSVDLFASPDPGFDFHLDADFSSFAGQSVTLFLDVINEDDGFLFDPDFDNFQISPQVAPVPEPVTAGLSLLGLGALALGTTRRGTASRPTTDTSHGAALVRPTG